MDGWIKDYRQELASEIWMMPPLYHRIWQWLKYRVNHEDGYVPLKDGSKQKILKGQFMTSIRSNNGYTLITIVNWEVYQSKNEQGNIEHPLNTHLRNRKRT